VNGRPENYRRRDSITPPEDDWLVGPFEAVVDDNADPKKRGVLLVRVPEVTGDQKIAAEPINALMGGGKTDDKKWGSLFLPPVGACVTVEYRDGDPSHPVWLPGWFADDEAPDLLTPNYPHRRGLVTPSGHALYFDDSDGGDDAGTGDLELRHRDGAALIMHDAGDTALQSKNGAGIIAADDTEVRSKDGKSKVVFGSDGTTKVTSQGPVTIDATGQTVVIKCTSCDIQ